MEREAHYCRPLFLLFHVLALPALLLLIDTNAAVARSIITASFLPSRVLFGRQTGLLIQKRHSKDAGKHGYGTLQTVLCRNMEDQNEEELQLATTTTAAVPLIIHHTAIKTRNITVAIQFYSLLGFQVTTRFRAGPARAAWLEFPNQSTSVCSCRLEVIEVPSFVLNEPEGMRRRAMDLMERQDLLGHNHFALDVTEQIRQNKGMENLCDWMQALNQTSIDTYNRMLRIALEPQQQMIGQGVFELAFLYDADGALVELLNKQTDLKQEIKSGWEPWDGQDFIQ
jgi:catechol 2,3-dioxygenase-like lactoylglutathione lyase family enzyme